MRKETIASLSIYALFAGAVFFFSNGEVALAQSCPAGQQKFEIYEDTNFKNKPVDLTSYGVKQFQTIYALLACHNKPGCGNGPPTQADKAWLQEHAKYIAAREPNASVMALDDEYSGHLLHLCCASDAQVIERVKWLITILNWAKEAVPDRKWTYYGSGGSVTQLHASFMDQPTSPQYIDWQKRNDLLKPVLSVNDVLIPNHYAYYADVNTTIMINRTVIKELKRLVPNKKIYLTINPRMHPTAPDGLAFDWISKAYFLAWLEGIRDAGYQGVFIWAADVGKYDWSEATQKGWWQAILEFQKGSNCVPAIGGTPTPTPTPTPSTPPPTTGQCPGPITYEIYQNGKLIDTTFSTTYLDTPVTPGKTYTYKVIAVDQAGNKSTPATVTATADTGSTFDFTADPMQIQKGGNTTLLWNIAGGNVGNCTANSGPSHPSWANGSPKTSTKGLHQQTINNIETTTTFFLSCMSGFDAVSKQVTVAVIEPPKPAKCIEPPSGSCISSSATCNGTQKAVTDCSGICCVPPGAGGSPPIVAISGTTPSPFTTAGAVSVNWSATNASSCQASGTSVGWSGSQPLIGSKTILNVSPGSTFTLTCTSPSGLVKSETWIASPFTPQPPPPITGGGTLGDPEVNTLVPCGTQGIEGGSWTPEEAKKVAEDCQFEHLITLIENVMNYLLFAFAIPLAAILFTYAGWLYLTAAGNESNVKKAHSIFFYVVAGLAIALAAWLIVKAIVTGLGVSITAPGGPIDFLGGVGGRSFYQDYKNVPLSRHVTRQLYHRQYFL